MLLHPGGHIAVDPQQSAGSLPILTNGHLPSSEFGLALGFLIGHHFLNMQDLHYGYWPAGLARVPQNLAHAQAHYTDFLMSHIPGGVKSVLDVGCGNKPYARWLTNAQEYPGPSVDVVVQTGAPWPFVNDSFDAVLCTQVLEHVADLEHFVGQIHRVLKPGVTLVVSGRSRTTSTGRRTTTYRRFSANGLRLTFERD